MHFHFKLRLQPAVRILVRVSLMVAMVIRILRWVVVIPVPGFCHPLEKVGTRVGLMARVGC